MVGWVDVCVKQIKEEASCMYDTVILSCSESYSLKDTHALINFFLLLDGFYKLPMYHKIKHNWIETKQDCLIATTLSHNIVWSHLSILSMKLTDY